MNPLAPLLALDPRWWWEVGNLQGGGFYCELNIGHEKAHLVGPAIRATADTIESAILKALAARTPTASPN